MAEIENMVYRGKWIYLGFRSEKYAHPESFYIRCPFCGHEEYVLVFEPRACRACGAELELEMPGRAEVEELPPHGDLIERDALAEPPKED